MPLLERIIKPAAKTRLWRSRPEEIPWFDRPDARRTLDRWSRGRRISEAERALLERWLEEGAVSARGLVPGDEIDTMVAELDPVSEPETQLGSLIEASASARRVHENRAVARLCALLLGEPALPQYSLYFVRGSEKTLHQDTAAFAVFPMNFIVGAWLACEDIADDAGPLLYYPGSHREPLMAEFGNYPQTSLKTCDARTAEAYEARLRRLTARYEERRFLAKKGDLLVWHGLLIHGGAEIKNPALTRRSYVWHYIPKGKNVEREIIGPFNW